MPFSWPHATVAAVSLTFDGATPSHLDVCRLMSRMDRRVTVYAEPTNLLDNPRAWRDRVAEGHELGAHPFFAATDEEGLIARLSSEAAEEEIADTKLLLTESFNMGRHSACMPLVKTIADDTGVPSVPEVIRRTIVRLNEEACGEGLRAAYEVIRTPLDRFNDANVDLQRLKCCCVDGQDAVTIGLIAQIAISQGLWAILSWGPSPDLEVVGQVARWLRRQHVWIAPVIEVADHVKQGLRADRPTEA